LVENNGINPRYWCKGIITYWWSMGARTYNPHNPYITEGRLAIKSEILFMNALNLVGTISVENTARDIAKGVEILIAIAEVMRVPRSAGSMPYSSFTGFHELLKMKDKPSLESIGYEVTASEAATPTTISNEVSTKIDKVV